MPRLIAFDWEADYVAGVEADVSGPSVHVRRCFRHDWPEATDPPQGPSEQGRWLAETLRQDGISTGDALLVLPREAVVVRKLELPKVPENELPELVRFQAATKSSTPLDRLALDYLPLPVGEADTAQQVLMVTVEAERLKRVRETLSAAGFDLQSVGISPVTVGELVTRMEEERSIAPDHATLVIFQDARRVEITALVEERVTFSHQSRLAGAGDAAGLKGSLAEVNRTVIALSQARSDLEITEVCLIHAGDADPEFESALAQRFGGRLHVLDVASAKGVRIGRPADRAVLASLAPALGALLAAGERRVTAIDFLSPRRAVQPPDRTKQRLGLAAAAAAMLGGLGYWWFSSHLADLVAQTEIIEQRIVELDNELKLGAPDLEAAATIGEWAAAARDPLAVMLDLHRMSPGAERVYLQELKMTAGGRDGIFRVEGTGSAFDARDVQQMQEVLERGGLRVIPFGRTRSKDPDYPQGFELQVELPAANPSESSTSASKLRGEN